MSGQPLVHQTSRWREELEHYRKVLDLEQRQIDQEKGPGQLQKDLVYLPGQLRKDLVYLLGQLRKDQLLPAVL